MAYGKVAPTTFSDPDVLEIGRCLQNLLSSLRLGSYVVNAFPILKFLPIPEVKTLERHHKDELALFNRNLDVVHKQLVSTTSR